MDRLQPPIEHTTSFEWPYSASKGMAHARALQATRQSSVLSQSEAATHSLASVPLVEVRSPCVRPPPAKLNLRPRSAAAKEAARLLVNRELSQKELKSAEWQGESDRGENACGEFCGHVSVRCCAFLSREVRRACTPERLWVPPDVLTVAEALVQEWCDSPAYEELHLDPRSPVADACSANTGRPLDLAIESCSSAGRDGGSSGLPNLKCVGISLPFSSKGKGNLARQEDKANDALPSMTLHSLALNRPPAAALSNKQRVCLDKTKCQQHTPLLEAKNGTDAEVIEVNDAQQVTFGDVDEECCDAASTIPSRTNPVFVPVAGAPFRSGNTLPVDSEDELFLRSSKYCVVARRILSLIRSRRFGQNNIPWGEMYDPPEEPQRGNNSTGEVAALCNIP